MAHAFSSAPPPPIPLTRKDFTSDQEVRWCIGCGDYSILAQVQRVLPTLGLPKEKFVFVSGIGCSSRFTYYMNTYGIHGIHGRPLPIATGVKLARPDLSVWVVTGDGDALAIGGNHLLHALRRNIGLKILLFNNRIYGLTKGQCSPTSEFGKKTKSTPHGSIEHPLDAVSVALGAGATFVARALATDSALLQEILQRAAAHPGTSFIEIYQQCVIFNPDAYESYDDPGDERGSRLNLSHGKPLRFGKNLEQGIALGDDGQPRVVSVADHGEARLLVHDERSETTPFLLSRLAPPRFPTPFGVLRAVEQPSYEELAVDQVHHVQSQNTAASVQSLLESGVTWLVE